MSLSDRILDEALAAAKARSHAEVEPRHVMWAIVRVLGAEAVADLKVTELATFLEPHGVSIAPPPVSAAAQASLDACTSKDSAAAEARRIARLLRSGNANPKRRPASSASRAAAKEASKPNAVTAIPPETAPAASDQADRQPESIDDILRELDGLIGLGPVKEEVRRLVAVQRLDAERRAAGLPEVGGSRHLVFTGDPGTGKTSVAHLVARLYAALGVLSRGHLVETSRADLVTGYVGQTALKVQEVVSRAIGGVLLIDEAYALAGGNFIDYGGEAVATLVKMMDDHRDDLVVIVAGYRDLMWEFIRSNPSLRSRFTSSIDFPNYTATELVQVFEAMATTAKLSIDDEVRNRVRKHFEEAQSIEDFGNARFVRSVFERSYANMAARTLRDGRIDPTELTRLTVEDLAEIDPSAGGHSRRIGFRSA